MYNQLLIKLKLQLKYQTIKFKQPFRRKLMLFELSNTYLNNHCYVITMRVSKGKKYERK